MEQLRNLKQIYSSTAGRFNQYAGEDFVLPQIFKDQVKEINSNVITYNKYSAVIETRGNQNGVLKIYMPNQWFYIASYFTDFYNELLKYKSYALKAISKERLKDLNGATLTDAELNAIKQLDIDDQSQEYLKTFITDYSWWSGAKTIDRGDFYVSPILNSARLVNASQSFVADLCAFLADKEELVKAIITGETDSATIVKKELLRQKAAATFMKKAMRITIDKDRNLSHLAALNKYRKTPVQLQINGFNLGRDKSKLPNRIDDVDINVAWIYDTQEYVLYLEWTPEMMELQFFPVYNEAYQGMLKMGKNTNGEYVLYEESVAYSKDNFSQEPRQQIFYGAPGTGKSHEIKEKTKGEAVVRTTFHPDSDYSTFVGAYKPTMDNVDARVVPVVLGESGTVFNKNEGTYQEKRIVYQFVMQAFLKAYLGAWKKYAEADGDEVDPQFLIIEEINRGNCAQIFGDLFQLLDRSDKGFSEYPIEADNDLQQEIERAFKEHKVYKLKEDVKINAEGVLKDYTSNYGATLSEDIQSGRVLLLPPNLYIWATMNTSDQSLFPIDSAFKRRWDWVYMPIDTKKEIWHIKVGDVLYSWTAFLEKINNEILTDETAEDKHLGFYFCKAENNEITQETFVGKVLFYLWNDVFKVYGIPSIIGSSKEWAYTKFYNTDGKVNEQKVKDLMAKLQIAPEESNGNAAEESSEQ